GLQPFRRQSRPVAEGRARHVVASGLPGAVRRFLLAKRDARDGSAMTKELVWVTRTDPFNRLTAKRLAGAGYEPLSAPALRVVAMPARPLTAVPEALVFTSLNGVRMHRF